MSEMKRLLGALGDAREEKIKNILIPIKSKEEYEFICDLINRIGLFKNSDFFSRRNSYGEIGDEKIAFLDLNIQDRHMSFSRNEKFSDVNVYIEEFHSSDKKRPIVFNIKEGVIKGKKIKLKI